MCDIQTICIETDDFEYYLAMKCEGYDDILLRKCLPVAKFQNIEAYRISEDGKLFSIVYVGDEMNHPIFRIDAEDFENPYIFVLKDAVVVMDRVCVVARNMMKFEAFKPTKAKVFGARSGFEMPFDFAGIAWCSDVFVNAKGNLVLVGASTEYQFGVRGDVLAAIPFEANNLFEHMPYGWKSAKEILLDEQALREKFEK